MLEFIITISALALFAVFVLFILGMIRPGLAFQRSRLRVAQVYISSAWVLIILVIVITPGEDKAQEPAIIQAAAPDVSQRSGVIEQLPDLTREEILEHYHHSFNRVSELTDWLLARYQPARQSGNYHQYNLWRMQVWVTQVDALIEDLEPIRQHRRKQLLHTPLSGIYGAPRELLITAVNLSGRIDQDNQQDREQTFKDAMHRIAQRYEAAMEYLNEVMP